MSNKGYALDLIYSKLDLKKEEKFEELKLVDEKIFEKLNEWVTSKPKPKIYVVKKDKKIKAIYKFDQINDEEKNTCLVFRELITTNNVEDSILKEKKQEIIESLIDQISLDGIKVIWDDTVIEPKTVKIGKSKIPLGLIIYIFWLFIGIGVGDKIWGDTGLIMGLCFGLCLGATTSNIIIKQGNKKVDNIKDIDSTKKDDK